MLIRFVTCCAALILSLSEQSYRDDLRIDNSPDVPIRVLSAYVSSQSATATDLDIHLKVENVGQLPVEQFSIPFPEGLYAFGYPLKPGETREIDAPLSGMSMKKTEEMARRGELGSWVLSVTELQWAEAAGVPIRLDLSARVEEATGLEVSLPGQGLYFPQEPQTGAAHLLGGGRVAGYALVRIQVRNITKTALPEVWWTVKGVVDGTWEDIAVQGSVGVPIRSQSGSLK